MAKNKKKRSKFLPEQIYEFPKEDVWEYEFVDAKRFKPFYTLEQRDEIARLYGEFQGGACFNGAMICLEGIHRKRPGCVAIELSLGEFFDFLVCNVVGGMKNDRFLRYCSAAGGKDIIEVVDRLMDDFRKEQRRIHRFEDLATSEKLPNVIAMSGLLYDEDGTFLVSKRTSEVIVGQELYGVTVTGSIEPGDMHRPDPFKECAARELAEETGITMDERCFVLRGFSASNDKLQPAAVVDVVADEPLEMERLYPNDKNIKEIRYLVGIGAQDVVNATASHDMTLVAKSHFQKTAARFIASILPPKTLKSVDMFFVIPA